MIKLSNTINKTFGNSITLQLPLDMRVRVKEINECAICDYNGSLCIFRYDLNDNYQFIKHISIVEAYYTIEPIKEYIDKYHTKFGELIVKNIDPITYKKIEKKDDTEVDEDEEPSKIISLKEE